MSITHPQVAIITVTFNSSDFIQDYLEALTPLLSNSYYKLIIVDNASVDNTCELIKQHIDKHHLKSTIDLIALNDNIGFGNGCNKGAEQAKAYKPSHLWFLNPDTKVFENTGETLLNHFTENPSADFVGSTLVNKDNIPRPGAFRFPSLVNVILAEIKLGILDKLFHKHTTAAPIATQAYEADWLTGASFMVKADCFYQLKGFDPFYFLYFEEVDLFYRAKQAGFSVWASPDSRVFHISGASTGINNHKKAIQRRPAYWYESRRYYYMSNFGAVYFTLLDSLQISCHLIWRLRAWIQKKEDDTPPYFIRDILRHSYPASLFAKK